MSTIIKAKDARAHESGALIQHVAFDFGDIADQARIYLEQVQQQAADIVRDAHDEAQRIRAAAVDQGREAAEATAGQDVDRKIAQQMETLLPALRESIGQLHDARHEWLNHWQQRTVALASRMAARIVRRELSRCPEITVDLVREALELAAGSAEITLHLNPDDYEALGSEIRRLAAEVAQLAPARVVADAAIRPGGCRVETRFGSIDGQIEAQLDRLEQELA